MSAEKINEIVKKADNWAKNQSTEKLEETIKNLKKIKGYTSFDEELQIKRTIKALNDELEQRFLKEILKTKEEILLIFK